MDITQKTPSSARSRLDPARALHYYRTVLPADRLCADYYGDDPLAVLAAVRELLGRDGPRASGGEPRSGECVQPGSGRPIRGGLYCPRIFGGGRRPERCGHIEVGRVLHPTLVPVLADILGIAAAEVVAVARGERALRDGACLDAEVFQARWPEERLDAHAGLDALSAALATAPARSPWTERLADLGAAPTDLLLPAVLVPPPRTRPLARNEAGQHLPGPDSAALAGLRSAAAGLAYYRELRAPDILVRHAEATVQAAFDHLWAAFVERRPGPVDEPIPLQEIADIHARISGRPCAIASLLAPAPAPRPLHLGADPWGRDDPGAIAPIAAALRDDSLLLHCRDALLHLRLDAEGAEIERTTPAPETRLLGVRDGIALLRPIGLHDGDFLPRWSALDLAGERWLEAWPEGQPPPLPGCPHETKRLGVFDLRRRSQRDLAPQQLGDTPSDFAVSPDLALVWPFEACFGGILELATGALRYDPRALDPGARRRSSEHEDTTPRAFVRTPSGRWRIAWRGRLVDGKTARATLDRRLAPLAFDAEGQRLVCSDGQVLEVIHIGDDGAPVARTLLDLAPLKDLLALAGLRDALSPAQVRVLRASFGSLAGLRAADPAALARLAEQAWDREAGAWIDRPFFTADLATQIVARAAGLALPRRLSRRT